MSNASKLSLFGRNPEKGAKPNKPEGAPQVPEPLVPAKELPSAIDALAELFPANETAVAPAVAGHQAPGAAPTPETIHLEHLSAEALEALFPSDSLAAKAAAPAQPKSQASAPSAAERRAKRRALISAPVRVRSVNLTHDALDDTTTTTNVSRMGILLATGNTAYFRSMNVMVTFPYSKAPSALQAEQTGRVVRISELPDGRRSVAIALGVTHHDEDFIAASGDSVHAEPSAQKIKVERDPNSLRPLVLALDAQAGVRESLTSFLVNEGYDVITVSNAQEARDVLSQCTPSLVIAEIEGEGMPGYDICGHCKATPRLKGIPVMLTTSSAYPSDYSSAHSLGAIVCMAKPYRQERLGHMVKMLAPTPNANDTAEPPRPADPSRRHLGSAKPEKSPASNVNRRFRLGRKS